MTNWIANATKNKGGFHRTLGKPQGEPITQADIARGKAMGGRAAKEANLAETLKGFRKKKSLRDYGKG